MKKIIFYVWLLAILAFLFINVEWSFAIFAVFLMWRLFEAAHSADMLFTKEIGKYKDYVLEHYHEGDFFDNEEKRICNEMEKAITLAEFKLWRKKLWVLEDICI